MSSKVHHYARLPNNSSNRNDEDEDDDQEEIELGGEHHIRYRAENSDYNEDTERHNVNGHAGGSVSGRQHDDREMNVNGLTTITLQKPGPRIMQMAIGTLFMILLYLSLSIGLTFYQKTLTIHMKFPLSMVLYHLIIKFMLSSGVRGLYRCCTGKTRVQLDWRTSIRRMAPTGIASGVDIAFSVWGLELVPISLYTMTKSSTIIFILFFAILFGLEKKSWLLVFTVGLVASGLFMFTYKATEFNTLGFIFILVGSLSSGIRWSLAQFVMQKSKLGLHNPVDMIYHMQPWMIVSVLPLAITFEGQKLYDVLRDLSDVPNAVIVNVFLRISFAAVLAFFMEISEFMVLCQTSSLTLSIAGVFKDICQLVLAVEINHNQLSSVNVIGLVLCFAGICCHLAHKYATMTKLEQLNALQDDDDNFRETNISHGGSGAGGSGSSATMGGLSIGVSGNLHVSVPHKHSALTVPLLEQTDSDDDSNMGDNPQGRQSASDVIFDVLKRRDQR